MTRLGRRSLLAIAALALALGAAAAAGPAALAGPSSCPPAILLASRGSGDQQSKNEGIGRPELELRDSLAARVPGLETWANPYAAVGVFSWHWRQIANGAGAVSKLSGLGLGAYHDSVVQGESLLSAKLHSLIRSCGGRTAIALAGYSQGAQVTADVFQRDLSDAERAQVAAVVLFGDPYFNGGDRAVDRGSFSGRRDGVLGRRTAFAPGGKTLILSYCHSHDPICQGFFFRLGPTRTLDPGALTTKQHKDYTSFGEPQDAAAQIAARIAPVTVQAASAPPAGGVDIGSNPVVLVVDISGSMGDDDGTGRIKIDGAKLALLNFLQQVEPGTPIGLRTYPDQSGSSCNTGTVRFPIAPRDPATMAAVIRSLQPGGDTPTAEAMRAAANDLKAQGYTHGTLVIVSDGEATCASPCDEARAIARSGIDLQTITVGFRISPAGEQELRCIAGAMHGTYVDAGDSAGLKQALARVSRPTLAVTLTYPSRVVAEVGDDPQGLVDVTGRIANTANQQARNVVVTMHFDGVSPGLSRPVVYVGNLDPGESRAVSWSFRPGVLLAGSNVGFSVSARADNTLSDGTAGGSIAVEQVNSAAQAGPILRGRHQLAILGDSYSSGEGADTYLPGTDTPYDGCHRSELTYLVGAFRQPDSSLIACSGAVVDDMYFSDAANHVPSQLAQLRALQQRRGVDAVVMTLGGNDALFSHVAISCLLLNCERHVVTNFSTPWDASSGNAFLSSFLGSDLRDSLSDVYTDVSAVVDSAAAIRRRGSVAPILVLAYADPLPLSRRSCLAFFDRLTPSNSIFVDTFVTRLNALVEAAVASARERNVPVFFVPNTEDAFQPDHTICDASPYARGLTSFNGAGVDVTSLLVPWTRVPALEQLVGRGKQELLHPNVLGYEAETNAIIRWSLSPQARADAAWLKSGEAARVPALPIRTSPDDLGRLAPGPAPVLQGGTSYGLTVGGFAPDSDVQIVVRSQPLLLQEAHADRTGTVRTRVGLPPGLRSGRHTLELHGAAPSGRQTRLVAIGFRVAPPPPALFLRIAEDGGAGAASVAVLAWLALGIARSRRRRAPPEGARATIH